MRDYTVIAGEHPLQTASQLARLPLAEIEASKIAGLDVLDRLVICLRRAGCDRIVLVAAIPPSLPRATALGIEVKNTTQHLAVQGPVLAASDEVLASAEDIRRVRELGGRLAAGGGEKLPLGVISKLSATWRNDIDQAPAVIAHGPAARVVDPSQPAGQDGSTGRL